MTINSNWDSPLYVEIQTERLIVRSMNNGDVASGIRVFSNPKLMEYYAEQATRTAEVVAAYVAARTQLWNNNCPLSSFSVFEKETGEFVGIADLEADSDGQTAKLGYILLQEHQGKKYAAEVSNALIREYLSEVNNRRYQGHTITKVIATVHPDNAPSIRVLEKIGMKFSHEGVYYSKPRLFYQLQLQW